MPHRGSNYWNQLKRWDLPVRWGVSLAEAVILVLFFKPPMCFQMASTARVSISVAQIECPFRCLWQLSADVLFSARLEQCSLLDERDWELTPLCSMAGTWKLREFCHLKFMSSIIGLHGLWECKRSRVPDFLTFSNGHRIDLEFFNLQSLHQEDLSYYYYHYMW